MKYTFIAAMFAACALTLSACGEKKHEETTAPAQEATTEHAAPAEHPTEAPAHEAAPAEHPTEAPAQEAAPAEHTPEEKK